MRISVDFPAVVHRRALELARSSGRSLSAVVADLALRGLGQLDQLAVISTDETSGFPVISLGRRVTSDQVAATSDEQ